MFNKNERLIREVLKKLSKQRVVGIAEGNAWIISGGIKVDDEIEAALRTCSMRGWIEPVTGTIPQYNVSKDFKFNKEKPGPAYRLTEVGWNVIHGSYILIKATFCVTIITLIITLVQLLRTH